MILIYSHTNPIDDVDERQAINDELVNHLLQFLPVEIIRLIEDEMMEIQDRFSFMAEWRENAYDWQWRGRCTPEDEDYWWLEAEDEYEERST